MRCLSFREENEDTVDDEHHVQTDGVVAAGEAEFFSDVENVVIKVIGIENSGVSLPVLSVNENGAETFEIFPRDEVAFYRRRYSFNPLFRSLVISTFIKQFSLSIWSLKIDLRMRWVLPPLRARASSGLIYVHPQVSRTQSTAFAHCRFPTEHHH